MKYLPHTDLLRRKNPSSRTRHHRRFLSAKSYRKLLHYIRAKNSKKVYHECQTNETKTATSKNNDKKNKNEKIHQNE